MIRHKRNKFKHNSYPLMEPQTYLSHHDTTSATPVQLSALSVDSLILPNLPLFGRIQAQEREMEQMAMALAASQDREQVVIGLADQLQVLVSAKSKKLESLETENVRLSAVVSEQNSQIQSLAALVRQYRDELEKVYTTVNWQRNLAVAGRPEN